MELLHSVRLLVRQLQHETEIVMRLGKIALETESLTIGVNGAGDIAHRIEDDTETVVGLDEIGL